MRASYRVVCSEDGITFIEDLCEQFGSMSVTNDAEAVVKAVLSIEGPGRIVYLDTEGQWDELVHDGKEFTGFAPYRGWVPFA